jgi:hypothetical protein
MSLAVTDRHMRIVTNLIQIKSELADKYHCSAIHPLSQTRPGLQAERSVLMVLSDRTDDIRVVETSEDILAFDVSDDALERAANIIGGQATPVTLVYGTSIVGNCACPV